MSDVCTDAHIWEEFSLNLVLFIIPSSSYPSPYWLFLAQNWLQTYTLTPAKRNHACILPFDRFLYWCESYKDEQRLCSGCFQVDTMEPRILLHTCLTLLILVASSYGRHSKPGESFVWFVRCSGVHSYTAGHGNVPAVVGLIPFMLIQTIFVLFLASRVSVWFS